MEQYKRRVLDKQHETVHPLPPGELLLDPSEIVITTQRLRLVPISENYAEVIFREFNAEITRYMQPSPAGTIQDTLHFITTAQQRLESGEALNCVVLDQSSEEFIGGANIYDLNTTTPGLSIWIKQAAQGYGYGREAIEGLKLWADTHIRYDHLTYSVDSRNTASRKIVESLGGVMKKEYKEKSHLGDYSDRIEYWI